MNLDPTPGLIDHDDGREEPLAAKLMFCTLHEKSYRAHSEQEAKEDDGIVNLAMSERIDRLSKFLKRLDVG